MNRLFVIGTSAGGLEALCSLLGALPADLPAAVLVVRHIGARRSNLPEVLQRATPLPVRFAVDGQRIEESVVLVAPPDVHLTVYRDGNWGRVRLSHGAKENFTRPAIDPLFRTAAAEFGPRAAGIVLSGYQDDGALGMQAIHECGGVTIVQDPATAAVPDMPRNAILQVQVDHVLALDRIAALMAELALQPVPPEAVVNVPEWVRAENHAAGGNSMVTLNCIGARSPWTCPACGGALWQIDAGALPHFRCHTGHAFTAGILAAAQRRRVEESLRSAIRALQEQERLARDLAHPAAPATPPPPARAAELERQAEEACAAARTLRQLAGSAA
ncbi:chemotaxis protein CheB [Oxalobacteraceae bacterium A2-2]